MTQRRGSGGAAAELALALAWGGSAGGCPGAVALASRLPSGLPRHTQQHQHCLQSYTQCMRLPHPARLVPRRALVAVGTLAGEHGKVRQMARELGFLSLTDSLKGASGKVAEAAAETAAKLRL